MAPITMSELAALPLTYTLPPSLLVILTAFYLATARYFATDKARAYLLSALSSFTMTTLSIPFAYLYFVYGLEVVFNAAQEGWLHQAGRVGVIFFGTYLFADLAVGYVMYPSQIGFLTGWVHHICYIGLMIVLLNTRLTPIFCAGAIMELPTFDLAISNLFPSVRNDLRFLSSFFLIRIAFHAYLLLDCLRPSSRAVTDGSWVPGVMLSLAFVLHVSWFRGGLQGHLKRLRAAKKGVSHKTQDQDQIVGEPIVDAAIKLDPSVINSTLPSEIAEGATTSHTSPGTPDDSPLVTPYTPSQTPFSLRDSYILNTLPNLSMPTMANLPTVSIPPIPSLSDLTSSFPKQNINFGFKDAVKSRWEGQRGKFGASMGLRGGAFGGLGLRRRQKKGNEIDGSGSGDGDQASVMVHEVMVDN